jgi:uncharacterized protein (DUF1684 family)
MHKIQLAIFISFLFFACSTKKQVPASTSNSTYNQEIKQHQTHYMADFIKDERAPLNEEDLKHVHFYPADESYECECNFQLTPETKPFELSTYSGKTKPFRQYGVATCKINKKETKVHLYTSLRTIAIPGYQDYLFLPFKDHTNSDETYGGGRYIDLKTGDIRDGKVTIDFNKCYNPWCAYSDGYNCPIPPIENHFDTEIKAGEKMWTGKKKKG